MAVTIELPDARRLALQVVLGQAAVTLAVAGVCWAIAGSWASVSALIGGGIGTLASLVMVAFAFGRWVSGNAERMLAAFYAGEVAKLVVVVGLLVSVFRWLRPAPAELLSAFGATFLVYWIVLAGALPAFAGMRRFVGRRG